LQRNKKIVLGNPVTGVAIRSIHLLQALSDIDTGDRIQKLFVGDGEDYIVLAPG
jgi:hypothetical protein